MFKLLKDKLKKAVQAITEKFEKKEEIQKEVPEPKEEVKAPEIKEEIVTPEIKEYVKVVEEEKKLEPEIKVVEEVKEEVKPILEEKKGLFRRLKEKIIKKITVKKLSEEDIEPILKEMENGLIESDVALEVAEKIKDNLKKDLAEREIKRGQEKEIVVSSFKNSLSEILSVPNIDLTSLVKDKKPFLILFLGFNGSGKTTSLAKVGSWLKEKGYSVVFAAADTFRAAAEEQLEEHAKKIGVKVIKHKYGADPAAVIFDAIEHAKAKGVDFVLADSAGRAHTNRNLMEQMKKIIKVNKPDLKILVIDSLTGNDAMLQARMFNEVGVDGLIFTKVDVNEKGGAILSVTHELNKPILFLGLGQRYQDFEIFDKEKFVNNILS